MSSPKGRAGNGTYRTVASNGYAMVFRPEHPAAHANGYVYEHRLVAEQKIGRLLEAHEQVHHIDRNPLNNCPDNLEVVGSRAEHAVHHRKRDDLRLPGEPNPDIVCACGCGAILKRYDNSGRPRRYISGHNMYKKGIKNG